MFCFKGDRLQIEIFGASHSQEIGVIMKNFPEERIDRKKLDEFLQRRRPLYSFSTERKETDEPIFSAFTNDVLNENVKVVIKNGDIRSGDYNNLYGKPRPSHADYAAYLKDGRLDFSGGGEFSGRMTAPLCIAGGIAKQLLENRGIYMGAYLSVVGKVRGKSYKNGEISFEEITSYRDFPSLTNSQEMIEEIGKAKKENDSVGGIVECVVKGMKKGVGGALFHLRQRQAQIQGAEGNLALHGDGKNLIFRLLKDDAHPAAQLQKILLFPGHGLPRAENGPGIRLQDSVAQQEKSGLSRAVSAQNRYAFSLLNGDTEAVHGVGAVRVGVGHVFKT